MGSPSADRRGVIGQDSTSLHSCVTASIHPDFIRRSFPAHAGEASLDPMTHAPAKNFLPHRLFAAGLVLLGFGFAAAGIYVGEIDDAPGAAVIGLALLVSCIAGAVRAVRRAHRNRSGNRDA